MNLQKPSQTYVEGRQIIISFVPESDDTPSSATTKTWAEQLSKHLNIKKQDLSVLVFAHAGKHQDENTRASGSLSDFLAVFTVDYVLSPPPEFQEIIKKLHDLKDHTDKILLWLVQYDKDDYQESVFYKETLVHGKHLDWHVLKGKGDGGARVSIKPEPGYKDDLADAASIIYNHENCAKKSAVCPKYQGYTETNASG